MANEIAQLKIRIRFFISILGISLNFCRGSRVGYDGRQMQATRLPLHLMVRERGSRFVRREPEERGREGSAAESTQRMNARPAVPC